MARKAKREQLPAFKEVIQVPLLPEMVDEVKVLVAKVSDVCLEWVDLANCGFVTSLAPNPFGGFSASIRDVRHTSDNAGLQFYSNGPSPEGAIAAALVKLRFLERTDNWMSLAGTGESTGYR